MRKYGKWVLTLGLMAAAPAVTNADGFLGFGARRGSAPPVARRTAAPPAQARRPVAQQQQAPNTNQQVAERIARALRDARLNGYDVEIEFKDGIATLKGDIADPAQRAKALTLVSQVPGVRQVSNQLKPRRAAMPAPAAQRAPVQQVSGQRPAPKPTANNQQLADSLAKSLSGAGLSGYDVQIRVEDGLATLAGSVGTPQQVAQAESVARNVRGITRVNNQLKVASRPAPAPRSPISPASYQMPGGTPARMASLPVPAVPSSAAMAAHGGSYGGVMTDGPAYDMPNVPDYAWPSYASYPNYAAVSYPTEYSPSAFPYIGPFYPYPQVPLGWRKAQLEWDDGYWNLNFNPRTERWFWFLNPKSWR